MKYYRVKEYADGKRWNRNTDRTLVKNELFTVKEVERYNINREYLKPFEVSQRKTYFFFGVRFCE